MLWDSTDFEYRQKWLLLTIYGNFNMRIKLGGTNLMIFLLKIQLQVKKLSTGTFIGEI